MTDLPSFDTINQYLVGLVNAQDDPSGCQIAFFPHDENATYIAQISFRGQSERISEAMGFLGCVLGIIREGNRHIFLRAMESGAEKDFERNELVTKGYLRLVAFQDVGAIDEPPKEEERILPLARLLN